MKSPKEAFKILKSFSFCRLLLKLSSVLHNNLLTALVKKGFLSSVHITEDLQEKLMEQLSLFQAIPHHQFVIACNMHKRL